MTTGERERYKAWERENCGPLTTLGEKAAMWRAWQAAIAAQPSVREALAELVAVKDLKERAEGLHFAGLTGPLGDAWETEYKQARADYIRRQPLAWQAARAALAAQPERARAIPREPTPEMLVAAKVSVTGYLRSETMQTVWFAMYDAAPVALPDKPPA